MPNFNIVWVLYQVVHTNQAGSDQRKKQIGLFKVRFTANEKKAQKEKAPMRISGIRV